MTRLSAGVCCRQYAAIVFIANIRFDLSRKKLAYLTFADFVHCSNLMITHWSHGSSGLTLSLTAHV